MAGCRSRSGGGRRWIRLWRRSRSGSIDSEGKIRADKAPREAGGDGLSRFAAVVAAGGGRGQGAYRLGHGRAHRPWVTEPGLWLQYDFGDGPVIEGRPTVLFCAWLAWSRFRVVIPLRDRTIPTVFDRVGPAFRLFGGAPTYG